MIVPGTTPQTAKPDDCPTQHVLEQFVDLSLADETNIQVRHHVQRCAVCQSKLDELASSHLHANPTQPTLSKAHQSTVDRLVKGLCEDWSNDARVTKVQEHPIQLDAAISANSIGSLQHYMIRREIASGGTATVFEATDSRTNKRVAIKFIRSTDAQILRRVEREARALATVRHPNVISVDRVEETNDGRVFLVMPLASGKPLSDLIHDQKLESYESIVKILIQVASGLESVHAQGMLHRDVKPSNIVVSTDGFAQLTDFGLASFVDEESSLTGTDIVLGTPAYMSPEQAQGMRSLDARSDLYSLGATLYECLTETRPFRGQPHQILKQIVSDEPVRPIIINPEVPKPLEAICLKAISKSPLNRYQTAADFREDLQRWQERKRVHARLPDFVKRLKQWVKRDPKFATALGLVLLTMMTGTAISTLLWWRSEANASNALRLASELQSNQVELEESLKFANSQKLKAEKRFKDVRQLANSYLFDVYPQIETIEGSLKARETIVNNALKYLNDLSGEASEDVDLQMELATAYEKIGDISGAIVLSNIGDTHAGIASYRKARALRVSALQKKPDDDTLRERLANNDYVTARTLWKSSLTTEAEESFGLAIKSMRDLINRHPDEDKHCERLAIYLIELGAIPAWNGQHERALELFEEAKQIITTLRAKDPVNPETMKTHSRLLRAISRILGTRGDVETAIAGFEQASNLNKELIQIFPDDFSVRRSAWLTENYLGEVYIQNDRGEDAVRTLTKAIEFPKESLKKEPENGVAATDLADAYFNLARAQRRNNIPKDGVESAKAACEVMQALIRKFPENREYQRTLAVHQTEVARSSLLAEQFDVSISYCELASETLIKILEADTRAINTNFDLCLVFRIEAQACHGMGDNRKALTCIQRSINYAEHLYTSGSGVERNESMMEELRDEKMAYEQALGSPK